MSDPKDGGLDLPKEEPNTPMEQQNDDAGEQAPQSLEFEDENAYLEQDPGEFQSSWPLFVVNRPGKTAKQPKLTLSPHFPRPRR